MEKIANKVRETARLALANGEVNKILGWKKGDFWYDSYPAFITEEEGTASLIWDSFCVANLSKYLIEQLKEDIKVGVFLKGCDARAFNQLLKDNRVDRDKVVIYGLPCPGMIDPEKVKKAGLAKGLLDVQKSEDEVVFITKEGEQKFSAREFAYDKCLTCQYPNPVVYDELLAEEVERNNTTEYFYQDVEEIEKMSPDERFAYWVEQFSKCIRCNACRNVCPACSCEKCIFDNSKANVAGKAKVDSEEQFFHIVRAYHVAGRCVDCGECSRVCPVGIPLAKLNRKIIKDITEFYGEHNAGVNPSLDAPLETFKLEDIDPFETRAKGGK